MIFKFIHILFAWPYGIVVGNLIASAIWAIPTHIYLHVKLSRIHGAIRKSGNTRVPGNTGS